MQDEKRKKFAKTRAEILRYMRRDLEGPYEENELLEESPRSSYITGMLAPVGGESSESFDADSEQEVAVDTANDSNDYSSSFQEESDDNDDIKVSVFRLPSSIGLSFYVRSDTKTIIAAVSWGDYEPERGTYEDKEGQEHEKIRYRRTGKSENVSISIDDARRGREQALSIDSSVKVYATCFDLESGYSLVSVYVVNRRNIDKGKVCAIMFQTKLVVSSEDGSRIFVPEGICRGRQDLVREEYYYHKRPIYARGRGCAAMWDINDKDGISKIESAFIPDYEIPGVSPEIEGFSSEAFSASSMGQEKNRDKTLESLDALANAYEKWIVSAIEKNPEMKKDEFREHIGNPVLSDCKKALHRIRKGIDFIRTDETAFRAFCFMNTVIYMQNFIKKYSDSNKNGSLLTWREYTIQKRADNRFGWRPFQLAFILMNIKGLSDPLDEDREIVDLLYFPTGGGKTEAYLGLMAYTIADRRLRRNMIDDGFERDGGVTVMLRYTLRLLTTQQRDRILRMIIAAEQIRLRNQELYGNEPITLGFWVGKKVTPNKFDEDNQTDDDIAKKILKQVPVCPFCGKPLEEKYILPFEKMDKVLIFCPSDKDHCLYSHENKETNPASIPIHMIDEEVYSYCPTVLLGTVDKFAQLPWNANTGALFGRVDRKCNWDEYVVNGVKHEKHKKDSSMPQSKITPVKPFLPPQLIIQDELHLITGPLGTIYGAYETMIDELSSYEEKGHKIRPKYVASTATIKNAGEQIRILYGRTEYSQFPPSGLEVGDSFFVRELPLEEYPFRKYVGIAAPGQSMKTVLLRVYAIILQAVCDMAQQEKWKDCIDPYYTLIGYFNSIRELGGAVRLLQDDVVKRIHRIRNRLNSSKERYLAEHRKIEITSRMNTGAIPKLLQKLEAPMGNKDCIDTALATNMIAVGLDVDRLGLMVVTGQPKQTSEYIQSTSRVGRKYPGLVVIVYNPYRPRDFSHYENFTGYHAEINRFVEGTTATPFSERARDRVLHALIITAIRLGYPDMSANDAANKILTLDENEIESVKKCIIERLDIVKPEAKKAAEQEIDDFIDFWRKQAGAAGDHFCYYIANTKKTKRLINMYGNDNISDNEKATLNSMRDVEKSSGMYYWEG